MKQDIYDFIDYREYLTAWITSQPKAGHGFRAQIATAIGSPVSHISQVLKSISHLSFEQAENLNTFLGHSEEKSEYFLLLLHLARAGTPQLRTRMKNQIDRIREKRMILKNRLTVKSTISQADQATYYSSWLYAAVHILLTIHQYQTREAIADYLNLSRKRTSEILDFLQTLGLAKINPNGQFSVGEARLHLGTDSPMLTRHHINWRMQAIQSLEKGNDSEDLHYSSVVSISAEDRIQIKSMLVKAIENAKAKIKDSPEEELHSFCLDFFKV